MKIKRPQAHPGTAQGQRLFARPEEETQRDLGGRPGKLGGAGCVSRKPEGVRERVWVPWGQALIGGPGMESGNTNPL